MFLLLFCIIQTPPLHSGTAFEGNTLTCLTNSNWVGVRCIKPEPPPVHGGALGCGWCAALLWER
jgi:hypothetical protein